MSLLSVLIDDRSGPDSVLGDDRSETDSVLGDDRSGPDSLIDDDRSESFSSFFFSFFFIPVIGRPLDHWVGEPSQGHLYNLKFIII